MSRRAPRLGLLRRHRNSQCEIVLTGKAARRVMVCREQTKGTRRRHLPRAVQAYSTAHPRARLRTIFEITRYEYSYMNYNYNYR